MTSNDALGSLDGSLDRLRCFYYAAVFRSFTRCADHLGFSQPSVSKHIRAIEHSVGASLFVRGRRETALTDAGTVLFELLEPVLEGLDALPATLRERLAVEAPVEVRLVAGQELLLNMVRPALEAFRQSNPDVRVVIYCREREGTLSLAASGAVDFGIAAGRTVPADLEFEPVMEDELVLIAPREHDLARRPSVKLADIAKHPLLVTNAASTTRATIEDCLAREHLEVKVGMELERWHVIKEFVAAGQGIAVVPRFTVQQDEDRIAIRPIRAQLPNLTYGFVRPRGHRPSSAARELMAAIAGGRTFA
jgi:DNA-binding transcriptional LysR family regulator